jgi:uncharacterized membrane protein
MHKGRLEAFSDGVFAIIITIMVLELKVPDGVELKDLLTLAPTFLSYVLSFIFVAIYWNNHHHMLQIVQKVNGFTLWANAHLLFWLSLIPFATAWMGEHDFPALPVALYGFVLLMCGLAYSILARGLVSLHGAQSAIARALGKDRKGLGSLLAYAVAAPLAFFNPRLSYVLYIGVAILWLLPDRRVEKVLSNT